MTAGTLKHRPWYREPWPWILMGGPAVVVVAGFVTAWLAVRSDDGLVAQDYYRRGLMVNQVLGRVEAAARAGLAADLTVVDGVARVRVERLAVAPPTLRLVLRHPTRSGLDRSVDLRATGTGEYSGVLRDLREGRWLVDLESSDWQLRADAQVSAGRTVRLEAR